MSKITCNICGKEFDRMSSYKNHIYSHHRFLNKNVYEVMESNNNLKTWILKDIDKEIVEQFYTYHKKFNNFSSLLDRQFRHFYELITSVRKIEKEDYNTFFDYFLTWKTKNPKVTNSKEVCELIFSDEEESMKCYSIMKNKNPFTGHTGQFSPFSKKFCGYDGLDEEEIKIRIKKSINQDKPGRNTNQVLYWVKKGFSEEDAKKKVSERQRTFSLEKCIQKYGKKDGIKRWQQRQDKWQNTLKSKTPEEIERINRAKLNNGGKSYSLISQSLFWKIYEIIKNDYSTIKFATLLNDKGDSDWSGKSHEQYISGKNNERFFLDFYIADTLKVIEFDGEYWHNKIKKVKIRDKKKDDFLTENGYKLLRVKEEDFRKNPEKIINECLNFIKEK